MELDKEQILDKMRELKFNRENDFIEKNKENNKVLNVKYLGKIEVKDELKQIYLLIEQNEKEDGNLIEVERYYTEDGEFLGGNNNSDQYDFIMLKEEYKDDENLLEKLQNLDGEGILDLNQIEEERLEEISLALGISKEEIKRMSEISTDEEIDKKEEKSFETTEDGKEVLSKEKVDKISTKAEIKTNQKVTDADTMESVLHVQGKGYKKIAVIDTDDFKDSGNSTRFSIVGIKEDGSAEKIDTLEQRYGTTPTKTINSLNKDGTKIEQESVNSIFQIKGGQQIAVDIGTMGTIEVSYVRTPEQDNQKAISIPIETQTVRPTTRDVRELMNERRNPRVKEEIQRIEEHKELGCEPELKDIDDNKYNDTHTHVDISDDELLKEYARKILDENDEIAKVYNETDVEKKLKETIKSDKSIDAKELVEKVEDEMKEAAKDEHEGPQHNR